MFRLRPRIRFPGPASHHWAPPAAPPAPMRSSAPNPPNPRSARPGGRAHRLGGRGRRLGGREHAHRRGRRRSRRIGLPRASRQARFMAVKKEPLRSGGRIGRRCMPGGWGGAGEAGGGLGGAQFSSCPGNGTSNPGTDPKKNSHIYLFLASSLRCRCCGGASCAAQPVDPAAIVGSEQKHALQRAHLRLDSDVLPLPRSHKRRSLLMETLHLIQNPRYP